MDSEKFDKIVLDFLYDELDELTRASAVRHLDQSARAKALYSELRATREVGSIPLVDPPAGLAEKIMAAEEQVRAGRPLHQRIGSLVSIVAGYAMRPQLGMAALLLLMVGSSLLLLRVKPGEPSSFLVTERGVPESEKESVALVPTKPPSPKPAAPGAPARSKRVESTPRPEAPLDNGPGPELATRDRAAADEPAEPSLGAVVGEGAGLADAPKSSAAFSSVGDDLREAAQEPEQRPTNCIADLAHYEALVKRPPSAAQGNDARWSLARCYEELGRVARAREAYRSLLDEPRYTEKARAALATLAQAPARATAAAPPPEAAETKSAAKAAGPAASTPSDGR